MQQTRSTAKRRCHGQPAQPEEQMEKGWPLLLGEAATVFWSGFWGERTAPEGERARERGSRVSSRFAQDGWLLDLRIRPINALLRAIKAGQKPLQAAAAFTNHLQKSQFHDRQTPFTTTRRKENPTIAEPKFTKLQDMCPDRAGWITQLSNVTFSISRDQSAMAGASRFRIAKPISKRARSASRT